MVGLEGQDVLAKYDTSSEGLQAMESGEIDSFFVLADDYLESGDVDQYAEFKGRWAFNGDDEWAFRDLLQRELIRGQLDPVVAERYSDPANFRVEDDGTVSELAPLAQTIGEIIIPMPFGMLLLIAAITGSGALLRSVAEEKETRMIEMLVTSASPFSIMTGKLLAVCITGLIHMAVWIAVGVFAIPEIFDRIPNGGELTFSGDLLITVSVSFVLGYFLYSTLAMFIGSVVSSAAEGQRQTGMLSLLAGMPVWLSGLILNMPDGIIARILTWFPFTAPTMLMVRLGGGSEISMSEIAMVLAMVSVTGLVMLWVAARCNDNAEHSIPDFGSFGKAS